MRAGPWAPPAGRTMCARALALATVASLAAVAVAQGTCPLSTGLPNYDSQYVSCQVQETLGIAPRPFAALNLLASRFVWVNNGTAPLDHIHQAIQAAIAHIAGSLGLPVPTLPVLHPILPFNPYAAPAPPPTVSVNATSINNRPQGDVLNHGNYTRIDYTVFDLGPPNNSTLPEPNNVTTATLSSLQGYSDGAQASSSVGFQASLVKSLVAAGPQVATATPFAAVKQVFVTYPATGAGFRVNGSDFRAFWFNAYANSSIAGINFTPNGLYTISPDPTNGAQFWYLYCYNNPTYGRATNLPFTWNLNNATIIFQTGIYGGTMLQSCLNTTINGPGYFYYPVANQSSTQGNITAIFNSGLSWNITVDAGFPTDSVLGQSSTLLSIIWNRATRTLRQNTTDVYPNTPIVKNTDGTYTFNFGYYIPNVFVNDILSVRGNIGNHMFVFYDNVGGIINGVTTYNPSSFGFYEQHCTNMTYNGNVITPWPYPVGPKGALSVQSAVADGMHSVAAHVGPRYLSNRLVGMGDDAIAIHANYFLVIAVDKKNSIVTIATQYYAPYLYVGDTLVAYSGNPVLKPLGSTLIRAISGQVSNPAPQNATSNTEPTLNLGAAYFFNVTVSAVPAGLGFDCLLADPNYQGNGFSIIGNTIANNRGRGVLLKAGNGAVSQNTILSPKFWSMQLGPELYWTESDYVQNVLISSNTFNGTWGGVLLGYIYDNTYNPGVYTNHRNVSILNNLFQGFSYAPLIVNSVDTALVQGNTFTQCFCNPSVYGNYYSWIQPSNVYIYVTYTNAVTVQNNLFRPTPCKYAPAGTRASPYTGASNNTRFTLASGD